jgi:uncharacterized protein (UPF0332 family)
MTDEHTKALIKYRIERAEETYNEALLMRTGDHWNACANRLYYACFYAVSALLVKYGPDGHPKSPTYGHLKIPHPPD